MTYRIDFTTASSAAIIAALGERLEAIRLSRNIAQAALAKEAGVSLSTMTRLANGQPVSLDSFVRVMQALQLIDHLAALLPDPAVRPVDRVRLAGTERQRASGTRGQTADWRWGDGGDDG